MLFTATEGYRHDSIAPGVQMFEELGRSHGFRVAEASSVSAFTTLLESGEFEVAVFLNTTGDVLDPGAESLLEQFVSAGGGWVGIHAAADAEYDWPFYGELLGDGAWFASHPPGTSTARIEVDPDRSDHRSVEHLPATFELEDE